METSDQKPQPAAAPGKPRVRLPLGAGTEFVHAVVDGQKLHTVCESAHCPNQGECWRQGTATFMINGDVCTRNCTFCAVHAGRPESLDPEEPRRVAEAAARMKLHYVVVTSVTRDDLPDGGAAAFAATIFALRDEIPGVRVEVLIPDFRGDRGALDKVFYARPDVLNHNIETVPRLYPKVRPQARYERSLAVITAASEAGLMTKSGLMLGLGETGEEIEQTLRDLRAAKCDIVTIGQYLRPSNAHYPVARYVAEDEFEHWRAVGGELGFRVVQAGALVRSSYHAHESFTN